MPYLSLFEVSQFHDNTGVLQSLINQGEPCVLFEDKSLYARPMYVTGQQAAGEVDDVFSFDFLDAERQFACVRPTGSDAADVVIIATGGTFGRALEAARELLLQAELDCHIIVTSRLYPIDITPLLPALARVDHICVIEEGTADGGWASYVAGLIHGGLWGRLRNRVMEICSRPTVIPAAAHLERDVLLQSGGIRDVLLEAARG
jgi:pyruvate/2-oxoglutarate/acetoin dehydrogenase E1 component